MKIPAPIIAVLFVLAGSINACEAEAAKPCPDANDFIAKMVRENPRMPIGDGYARYHFAYGARCDHAMLNWLRAAQRLRAYRLSQ